MSVTKILSTEEIARFRDLIERSDVEIALADGSRWLATLDQRDAELAAMTQDRDDALDAYKIRGLRNAELKADVERLTCELAEARVALRNVRNRIETAIKLSGTSLWAGIDWWDRVAIINAALTAGEKGEGE